MKGDIVWCAIREQKKHGSECEIKRRLFYVDGLKQDIRFQCSVGNYLVIIMYKNIF